MASPASTLDSLIVLAARATNLDIDDSDDDCEQTFIGSRVAVKLGILTFFGTIIRCRLSNQNTMLLFVKYDGGVDEEEVLITG